MRRYVKRPWTQEERVKLTHLYYIADKETLIKEFPDRTLTSLQKQAKYLRDRGWVFKRP
mgnify:FL=1